MTTKHSDGVTKFNLTAEVKELESRKPWPKGLTSKTLLKTVDLRIVLIAMESAAKMEEHHSDGRISIHALSGTIRVHVQQQEAILRAGDLISLDRSIKHDVEAMEDSVFLLTIAWPTAQELLGLKHRGYGS
jgi:quercetin dioxygenase-like cupin family protein